MNHRGRTRRTHLVAQAYSLYADLRYHLGPDAEAHPTVQHAYARYRRRLALRY